MCGNDQARFLAGCSWLAISHFQTQFSFFPQTSQIILCKTSPDPTQFWPTAGPEASRSGSKPVCKTHPARFWPMLPSRSGPDANRIRHVYWVAILACTSESSVTVVTDVLKIHPSKSSSCPLPLLNVKIKLAVIFFFTHSLPSRYANGNKRISNALNPLMPCRRLTISLHQFQRHHDYVVLGRVLSCCQPDINSNFLCILELEIK